MPDSLYTKTLRQTCPRALDLDPKHVLLADDALTRLPEVLGSIATARSVTVLQDVRTKQVAGAEAMRNLADAGWSVRELLLEDPAPGHDPVCDDVTKNALAPKLGTPDLVLAVGSGVVNDLAKWLAYEADRPYACFATAASMNGYSSANVAPAVGGVKTLLRARAPVAVLSSLPILAQAPIKLTTAGLGDILAKSVSGTDWVLNHILFGDEYIPESVELITGIEPLYLQNPEGVARGDADALDALFTALLLTGVAMTVAGSSSPASGGEHLISHTLDMLSSLDGVPHDLHGRQVGIGTTLCSELYRRVLAVERPALPQPDEQIDRAFWKALAPEVASHYAQKIQRLHKARDLLADAATWNRLRERLAPMLRAPETTRDCLKRAGGATTAKDLGIDRNRLRAAFVHAREIRSRFTILDLAHLVGVLPGQTDEVMAVLE